MYNLEELKQKTLQWSHDRGILQNGKPSTQMLKLNSEAGELCGNVRKYKCIKDDIGDCLVLLTNIAAITKESINYDFGPIVYNSMVDNAKDYALDLQVTMGLLSDNIAKEEPLAENLNEAVKQLIILADIHSSTLEECWTIAYNDIKDRKGLLTKDGNFVKDTDPAYEQLKLEFTDAVL